MHSLVFQSRGGRTFQRGVTLIEALVALVVMSFGMVALVGLLSNLRQSGDLAKQRSEAMRIAQAEIETLRAFSVLKKASGADPSVRDYEDNLLKVIAARTVVGENSNTSFVVERKVVPLYGVTAAGETEPQAIRGQTIKVTVTWEDRGGGAQKLALDTVISRTDPAFSFALGVTPPTHGVRTPDGRNPAVPPGAKDLGNGSSAFRPGGGSPAVWVFNNASGVITGLCDIAVDTAVSTLTPSSVESCKNNTIGYLVSGAIRFSSSNTPRPEAPDGTARPVSIYVNLIPSEHKETKGGLEVFVGGRDYPLTPNHVCFTDAPTTTSSTQTFVNYNCIVYPNTQTPRNWWGKVYVTGLDLGTSATQFKVCRYSADYNGNGYTYWVNPEAGKQPFFKIDNEEHPETYRAVSHSLARQNFLVVRGDVSCPSRATATDLFIDYATHEMPLPPAAATSP
ncbi:type IV pilus modification PilV family protein [Roseateles sp. LYH14W]|uniref:Prepilin-type N-terminal cleavage/methylation domain-containing protein n=1 Tax=Pelomonas parva TaxID=3299032 RepID=A0ABW7F6Q5_9BURK